MLSPFRQCREYTRSRGESQKPAIDKQTYFGIQYALVFGRGFVPQPGPEPAKVRPQMEVGEVKKLAWLLVMTALLAAAAPLAANGQETIWRHPQAKLEKQEEGFFRPIMFPEEFARTVVLTHNEYINPEGQTRSYLDVRTPVKAMVAQFVCQTATRFMKSGPQRLGIALVAADIPQAGFVLGDQRRQSYVIPRIRVETNPVYTDNVGGALNIVAPVISAVIRGDVENENNCAVFLLRTSSAYLQGQREQYDALVVVVDEVIRVSARTIFPPPDPAPPLPPPGPPYFCTTAPPLVCETPPPLPPSVSDGKG